MVQSLSTDLRERVLDAVDDGMSCRGAAERFGVAISTVIKWVRRWHDTGVRNPMSQGGDKRSHRIEVHHDAILALIDKRTDITLAEIKDHLEKEYGLCVAQSTVWRFFERHNITFKKTAHATACG